MLPASAAVAWACGEGWPETVEATQEWWDRSDVVAVGTVADSVHRTWVESGEIVGDAIVRISIVEWFKGPSSQSEIIVDLYKREPKTPHFETGDTYLVFAQGPGEDGRFATDACSILKYATGKTAAESFHRQLRDAMNPILERLRLISE